MNSDEGRMSASQRDLLEQWHEQQTGQQVAQYADAMNAMFRTEEQAEELNLDNLTIQLAGQAAFEAAGGTSQQEWLGGLFSSEFVEHLLKSHSVPPDDATEVLNKALSKLKQTDLWPWEPF